METEVDVRRRVRVDSALAATVSVDEVTVRRRLRLLSLAVSEAVTSFEGVLVLPLVRLVSSIPVVASDVVLRRVLVVPVVVAPLDTGPVAVALEFDAGGVL